MKLKSPEKLSPKRRLLYDRCLLIRALQRFIDCDYWTSREFRDGYDAATSARCYVRDCVQAIRKDVAHFLSLSQDDVRLVSYAPKLQWLFDNAHRTKTTLSKYIRRVHGYSSDTITDRDIESMGYAVFGDLGQPERPVNEVKVVTGQDITDAYYHAVGQRSCMTGNKCENVKFYAINPERVALAVLDNDKARALVWTCDDGVKVLDRIYPNYGEDRDLTALHKVMKDWAKSQGMVYRISSNMGESLLSDRKQHKVTMKMTRDGLGYPYMDTFIYAEQVDHTLILSNSDESRYDYVLQSENGTLDGSAATRGRCGCHLDEDDVYRDEDGYDYCYDCYHEAYFECYNCGREEYIDERHEGADENDYCERCFDRLFVRCEGCDSAVNKDDALYSGDDAWCADCFNANFTYCADCGEAVDNDDAVTRNDDGYCADCADRLFVVCRGCGEYHKRDECDDDGSCLECADKVAV